MGLKPSGWTEEKRKAQAERTRAQKPWLATTGPKTLAGKKRSSRNALKHGQRSARTIRFKRILRQARKYLAFVKSLNRIERERRRIALGLIKPYSSRPIPVIPAQAGIPLSSPDKFKGDSRFRGNDKKVTGPIGILEAPNTIKFDIRHMNLSEPLCQLNYKDGNKWCQAIL